MKTNKIIAGLAGVVIGFAAFLLWRQFSSPTINLRPSNAVGEVLAEEVVRMLGATGKVVLVGRSASRDGGDASGEQIASLQAALKNRASASLAAIEWLPRSPVGTMDLGGVAAGQLLELIDKNKDANAFVVFAGLPPFSQELAAKLATRSLKLLAVCGYNANVRHWLEARALSVAVVPRSDDLPARAAPPRTAADWFEREFQMVTPENVGRLATP
jgi:hypothetical protein